MIEKVKLYDIEIVEIEGEFKEIRKNEEILPCILTNYSLHYGKQEGLLETSLSNELYNVAKVFEGEDLSEVKEELNKLKEDLNQEELVIKEELIDFGSNILKNLTEVADEDKIMKIIYLGLIGANPGLNYNYENFIMKYHGDLEEKMSLYVSLITNTANRENRFKTEFENLTSTKRLKDEKK